MIADGSIAPVAALLDRFAALEWLEHADGTRALRVTPRGRRGFRDVLGIDALGSRYTDEDAGGMPAARG